MMRAERATRRNQGGNPINRCHWPRLVVGLVGVLTLVGASTAIAPLQAQPAVAQQGDGLATLGACVNTNRTLLVDLLVDTSGSLADSDPENFRVPALRAALGSLLSLTRPKGANDEPTNVEVQISSFDSAYTPGNGFVALSSDSIGGLLESTEFFRSRNVGSETDYVLALQGAQASLAARSSELTVNGGQVCRAILWFTDGTYDISNSPFGSKSYAPGLGGSAAIGAGVDALCRSGGVADQLRTSEIVNVAVALTGPTFQSGDLDFLRAIVLGDPPCGEVANPEKFGVLLDVSDVNLLTSGMLAAISGTSGVGQEPGQVCEGAPCARRVEVQVPEGVGSFYLLTTTASSDLQRWLQAPDGGPPVLLQPGAGPVRLGNSDVEPLVISSTTVMVDVSLDPTSPDTGTWSVDFVDPTGQAVGELANVEVYLFGALRAELAQGATFEQGVSTTLTAQVVDGNGEPVSGELAQQTTLAISVVDPVTAAISAPEVSGPDANGGYTFDYVAASESTAAALNVTLSLSVVLDGGPALRPVVIEYAVPVAVPTVVPELVAGALTLGSVEGDGVASGALRLTGPERGEGRACLRSYESTSLPEGVASAELAATGSCVSVAAGATADLPVAISPASEGTGTARGVVEVSLEAIDGSQQTIRSVPVSFDMLLAPNRPVQVTLALLLTLLGVGIPLALFWFISRATTTFRSLNSLQWAEVPVQLDATGLHRLRDGAPVPLDFKPLDWKHVGGESARSFTVGGSGVIEVSVLHRTFSLSDATVGTAGADVVGSSGHRRRGGHTEGIVPLELSESWGLVVDSITFDDIEGDDPDDVMPTATITGRAVAFIDDRHEWVTRAEQLSAEITSRAADTLEPVIKRRWQEEVRQRAQEAAGGAAGAPVTVTVGGAAQGAADGAPEPPWTAGSTTTPASSTSEPTSPPWESPPGGGTGSDQPPERPW